MKTSNVLASLLFSTVALAAPLDRRAYATKTEIKVEYYTVYTTVTGAQPAAAATSSPALFYEEKPTTIPEQQPTTVTTTTSSSAAPSTQEPEPTTAVPTVVVPTTEKKPEPTTTSVYTPPPPPPPAETTQAPAPTTADAAPPSATSVAAAPSETSGSGDGETYTGGSYTMNYYGGALGACGEPVNDSDMAVALGVDVFGEATVDYMTGKTNNPWCGKKIEITNDGKTAIAWVKDRCTGCTMGGLDATPALWEATTGGLGGANGDRIYSMSWKVVE